MQIIKEQFKTLESMIDIMDRRAVNKAFKVKEDRLSSQRVDDDKKPWAGTGTWAETMALVKNGYSDPLKKMKTELTRIGAAQTAEKRIRYNDVIGFIPNVPNALRGVPLAMINQKRIPKKVNAISLIYSLSVSANVGPAEMINAGINFISLVNMLEKKGYRVKIDISFIARTNNTTAGFLVTAKEYNQTLNLLKLAFPLVQPAMLRRVAFKWLETTPNMKDPSFPQWLWYTDNETLFRSGP